MPDLRALVPTLQRPSHCLSCSNPPPSVILCHVTLTTLYFLICSVVYCFSLSLSMRAGTSVCLLPHSIPHM